MKMDWNFKRVIKANLRGVKEIYHITPHLFTAATVYACSSALLPYVSVFFSAKILQELSALKRMDVLWKWVAAGTLVTGVLAICSSYVHRKYEILFDDLWGRSELVFCRKAFSMDFSAIDKRENMELRSQIQQNKNIFGWGLGKLPDAYLRITENMIGLLSGIVLIFPLFRSQVPAGSGHLTLLNHPIFIVLFLAVIFFHLKLNNWFGNWYMKGMERTKKEVEFGSRAYLYWLRFGLDNRGAADVRVYKQWEICKEYWKKYGGVYGAKGPYGTLAKREGGIGTVVDEMSGALLVGLIYLFTCLKAWSGAFDIGSATQYIGAATALIANISVLQTYYGYIRNNSPYLEDIYRYLDIPNEMYQGSLTTEKRNDRQYEMEFRNVSFRYPESEQWALKNVSMKFKVGKRLAIVGENGSGKTTFIKLLCRLYDPQEGQILLNGIDIRKYKYDDYMNIFSVVFQDFQLLSQPIGMNVAGSMEYDAKKAEMVLEKAGFGERLRSFPKGLDTQLYHEYGEEGVEVSGGEAQKIAIARALYKDAPFIILDEPTAALDPIAEAEIYGKFNEISGDKTAVYISHRLSSCKFCDEIAVFKDGNVVQMGKHEELLAEKDGKYYELWNAQAQYYTE